MKIISNARMISLAQRQDRRKQLLRERKTDAVDLQDGFGINSRSCMKKQVWMICLPDIGPSRCMSQHWKRIDVSVILAWGLGRRFPRNSLLYNIVLVCLMMILMNFREIIIVMYNIIRISSSIHLNNTVRAFQPSKTAREDLLLSHATKLQVADASTSIQHLCSVNEQF